jgi:eukaryotic-like serine/threonine-protein kinase
VTAEAHLALRSGEVFASRYRVERLIGEGGMGAVYQVFDEQLEDRVALKLMSFRAGQRDDITRFVREVRLARRITHPSVARTHDIGEHAGHHFLTMELIEGETLDQLLADRAAEDDTLTGRLAVVEAMQIAIPVAEGLQAAHDAGVVHRDLKPANVMVEHARGPDEHRRRVVITDFGVARSYDAATSTTGIIGTPLYMSPEQVMGEALSPRSDLFSLGVMLYEMLTGAMPFDGPTPMAAALARCQRPPTDPRPLVDAPAALLELVLACLELSPSARPESAAAVAASLRGFARAASAETMIAPSASAPELSHPFAPMSPGKRLLAVLPFAYRGPKELDYLGVSLTQELTDALSRTRGLRVLGFGASSAQAGDADPRAAGRALAADVIASGSVTATHERVRVDVRLTEVVDGLQIWSGRFDKRFEDVFEMQEIVSQRVADALRVELTHLEHRWRASAAALELYYRARKLIDSTQWTGAAEAAELLTRCLELSPDFGPAMAAHANASVKAWWVDMMSATQRDWPTTTAASVARALRHADELAETHLAAAMYALQLGELGRTASELATTLGIAPGLSEAHRYLAELQCEAGRTREGMKRARLVLELDPTASNVRFPIARYHALRGDRAAMEAELAVLADELGAQNNALVILRMRLSLWLGDRDAVDRQLALLGDSGAPVHSMVVGFARYALGVQDDSAIDNTFVFARTFKNSRLLSLIGQFATEAHALRGDHEAALGTLGAAAAESLVDIEWLQHCPVLAPLRADPRFPPIVTKVHGRAEAIWTIRQPDSL